MVIVQNFKALKKQNTVVLNKGKYFKTRLVPYMIESYKNKKMRKLFLRNK